MEAALLFAAMLEEELDWVARGTPNDRSDWQPPESGLPLKDKRA
jgi:hypothetical protein